MILTVLVLSDGKVADAFSKLFPTNTDGQNLPLQRSRLPDQEHLTRKSARVYE